MSDTITYVLSTDSGMTYTCTPEEFQINAKKYGSVVTEISKSKYNELRNEKPGKDAQEAEQPTVSPKVETPTTKLPNFEGDKK